MSYRTSVSNNTFRQLSSLSSISRASQNSDDSFGTAKSLGSLRASSSPVSFSFKGRLSKSDRDDFLKLEIAPGAAFASISNKVTIKGGNTRLAIFFEFPGSAPQQASSLRYRPGSTTQVSNTPFANTVGIPLQLYLQVRSLNARKNTSYNFKLTFSPQ